MEDWLFLGSLVTLVVLWVLSCYKGGEQPLHVYEDRLIHDAGITERFSGF